MHAPKTVGDFYAAGHFTEDDIERCIRSLLDNPWLAVSYTCSQGIRRAVEIRIDIDAIPQSAIDQFRQVVLKATPRRGDFRPVGKSQ